MKDHPCKHLIDEHHQKSADAMRLIAEHGYDHPDVLAANEAAKKAERDMFAAAMAGANRNES